MMNNNTSTTTTTTTTAVMTTAAPDSREANFAAVMLAARAAGNTCAVKRPIVESSLGIAFDEYKSPFYSLLEGLNELFIARAEKSDAELEKQRAAFELLKSCFAFAGALPVNGDLEDLYTTFRRVARSKDTRDAIGNIVTRGETYSGMVSKETFRKRVEMHIGARLAGRSLRGGEEVVMSDDEKKKMQKRIDKFNAERAKKAEEEKKKAEEARKRREAEYAKAVGAAPKKKAAPKKVEAKGKPTAEQAKKEEVKAEAAA